MSDQQAIMISGIFPTGYFGAKLAETTDGDTAAVFGCGPVCQSECLSHGDGKSPGSEPVALAVGYGPRSGHEVMNFDEEDPVNTIHGLTGGIGADVR